MSYRRFYMLNMKKPANQRGLDFYRRIAADASSYLVPGGAALVEIGATQEVAVRELFATRLDVGPTYKDAAGRPRVVSATRRPGS